MTRGRSERRILELVASYSLSVGCHASTSSNTAADEGCDYEEREVSLDARFGDETPRAVIDLLERPVDGRVAWYSGEGEYVDVGGAEGEAEFHARAVAAPTVRVREGVEGKGGVQEDRIFCPTQLLFDVAVSFETSDGALVEDWSGNGTYDFVSGTLGGTGAIQVIVEDPRPFAGSLSIVEHPEVFDEWETHELSIMLNFATHPIDFVGMNGTIRHYVMNLGDGEGVGATTMIGEFAWPL